MLVNEVIVKIVGKMFPDDFEMQKKLENVCEEVLYNYEIGVKSQELMVSDIPEKAQLFLGTKRLEGLSPRTLVQYKNELIRLSNMMNRTVASITTMDLKMYFASMTTINQNTLGSRITVLKSFFGWLVEEEYLTKNPMTKIKRPKVPKRLRKPLSKDVMEVVKDVCKNDREKALIEFMVSSGCRADEVSKLKISNINFNDNSCSVIGKGDKERIVRFSPAAKLAMKKYIKNRKNDSNYMFGTVNKPFKNMETRQIQRLVQAIKDRTGLDIKLHPHILRHTFCTNSVRSGMSLPSLQSLMGHESLGTTQRYFDADANQTKSEYERVM